MDRCWLRVRRIARNSDERVGLNRKISRPKRLSQIQCSFTNRGSQSAFNCRRDVGISKRLLKHDCAGPFRADRRNVTANKNMRYKPIAKYCVDCRNAASVTQSRVNNHKIRPILSGSPDGARLSVLNSADLMTHLPENLSKQHADESLVFHNQYTKAAHNISVPPFPVKAACELRNSRDKPNDTFVPHRVGPCRSVGRASQERCASDPCRLPV